MNANQNFSRARRINSWRTALATFACAVLVPLGSAVAADFTVVNKCTYTVLPGIFPASYANGGWSMAPGASVKFTLPSGWIGRIWGRTGCNGANPAVCSTGQCGGTGLQCAGTTGLAGTSLAEFNLNAAGTDWYDVSYVDGFDNPIGISVSNPNCKSPNACTTAPLANCSADLRNGNIVDIWTANGTGAQTWVLSNVNVSPASYYNLAVSYGPYCLTASSPTSGAAVNLQACNGSAGRAWSAAVSGGTYMLHPASNTSLCQDVSGNANGDGTPVIVWTCNGGNNERWAVN